MQRNNMAATGFATVLALTLTLALGACGKVQEKASEKMVEKAIESSMAKDGTQAQVKLGDGSMKVTTTDAAGKTTQMEMGNAQIGEAELGVPFYPGAKPLEGSSMRVASGQDMTLRVGLHSDDAPDKVAAYYRDKLKAMAEGKQLMDMSSNEGAMLSLIDDKSKGAIQVHVGKADKGSDIVISSSRSGAK